MNASRYFRFGDFELQPDERRLLAAGKPVRVGRHAFDLLLVLAERAGHLVTKDELLERVWPKLVVEENTLQAHVSALRKILGSDAIATVSGRGYRFVLDVTHGSADTPAATASHNLPHSLTSFVGREKEVAQLRHLLTTTRFLTLVGSGGCGKTRLAFEAAAEQARVFADGVRLVELAALADPALVPQTSARVLGVKEQRDKSATQSIVDHLRDKQVLVLFDNAEHVLGACAQLVDAVLRACPRVVVFVTSRERLGVMGELTFRVPSLSVPDSKKAATAETVLASESARLFVERARLQRPHFAVTADNAAALASICLRLDGIPLAIELAAPRLRSMTIEELGRRLDQRFSLLTGGARAALPRQRTLRALIDWSYDLLGEPEQALLRRVSVFSGGWDLEAAEQVCVDEGGDATEVLDLLASLVDKNLIWADERDGLTRYGLLETVRHYARDQLRDRGEEAQAHQRHLGHFLALSEAAEPQLDGADQRNWLERLATEHENLRAAMAWSLATQGNAERGLRLATALQGFWSLRGFLGEGRDWLARLLGTAPNDQPARTRARGLHAAGMLGFWQGDHARAIAHLEESLQISRALDEPGGTADALYGLGVSAWQRGDFAAANDLFERSLTICRDMQDLRRLASALSASANVFHEQGDSDAFERRQRDALALFRQLGDRRKMANALVNLGVVAIDQGDAATARTLCEEGSAIHRELGDKNLAYSLHALAGAAWRQGDHAAAMRLYREVLTLHRTHGDRAFTPWALEAVAWPICRDVPRDAARLWGAAERLRQETGALLPPRSRKDYERNFAIARAALSDDDAFDRAWQEGRAMSFEEAISFATDAATAKLERLSDIQLARHDAP